MTTKSRIRKAVYTATACTREHDFDRFASRKQTRNSFALLAPIFS